MDSLRILAKHCPIVVITRGAQGAVASDGRSIFSIGIPRIEKVDTAGAGDAFNSAFTAAIAYGKNIETALRWGTANANSVIQNIGTKNILLNQKGIEEFWGRATKKDSEVKVQRL
jgi:sugar/nucleoside kinase (ribokinase family)